jgi:sterol 3beta-glucosyltransferase
VAIFVDAARRAGVRAIIQSDIDPSSSLAAGGAPADRILFIKRAPHHLVFPRCAAIVHHAGAGTTHTTLRAGVPSVAVPHLSDQFLWADELRRVGVAPRSIRRTKLTAALLAARIRAVVRNPHMKDAAMRMSARMRHDNGPETAADLIEARWNRN